MTHARLGRISWFPVLALTLASWVAPPPDAAAQQQSSRDQPFFGVTTDGELIPDLFPIRATGVSTAPIVEAARAYPQDADARADGGDRLRIGLG